MRQATRTAPPTRSRALLRPSQTKWVVSAVALYILCTSSGSLRVAWALLGAVANAALCKVRAHVRAASLLTRTACARGTWPGARAWMWPCTCCRF